jgi:hypothetical protein
MSVAVRLDVGMAVAVGLDGELGVNGGVDHRDGDRRPCQRACGREYPAKMTSSMRLPRRLFADCSPKTQLIASLRFDLPHPFGPTMAAMPAPWKRISERSQKDLNP